ncbi:MAG TPA: anthranilate synthase component I family protein [Verrucomicrobiae bacterium]|nr:anthranilate synthase component I family protein [Verrucomicrobiae bacterium]
MRPLINEVETTATPDSLAGWLLAKASSGVVLLEGGGDFSQARYSLVTANPFMVFRSFGSRCEIVRNNPEDQPLAGARGSASHVQFGNPWQILDALMSRCELLDELDLPFPLGGCFGFWGYDLKNFTEPKLPRRALNDLELADCHVGFYDSLVIFDHQLGKTCIVSTGLDADGSRSANRANKQSDFWKEVLGHSVRSPESGVHRREPIIRTSKFSARSHKAETEYTNPGSSPFPCSAISNVTRVDFVRAVKRAQEFIRAGDIYQVNLSQRLTAPGAGSAWNFFRQLNDVSPAPFAAYLDCGDFHVASTSPEQFLRLSGSHIVTRPIKGTRPRSADATRDAQLAYELQTSAKEMAELIMITDLLRNDLGKVCDFGSVQVPELARLEKFAQVQHLVSTVEGRLRRGVTHFAALASSFPGGSITGAPKFRAMQIIDELEPVTRGPYCGCHGYLGFNRESQLSITIRTAICGRDKIHFNVGAGIVADSDPEAEYEETLAKGEGFRRTVMQAYNDPVLGDQSIGKVD